MIYTFGDCKLDLPMRLLHRAGQLVPLRPKVFQVLVYLLTYRDRVVTKQELSEAVWPGQFISDTTLETTIATVRRALGDSGRTQHAIQTLRGHGYHFVAPVTGVSDMSEDAELPKTADLQETSGGLSLAATSPLPLAPEVAPSDPPMTLSPEVMASDEHRQLTILWCSVRADRPLTEQLVLDDYASLLGMYQRMYAPVVQRYGAVIAQTRGEEQVIYFGYPLAYEDAACRAVYCGLALLEVWPALQSQLAQTYGLHLTIHLGSHTGRVITHGTVGVEPSSQMAVGDVPCIAAGLQAVAKADTLLISNMTYRLIEGFFTCHALGPQSLPGSTQPQLGYRVISATGAQSRLDAAGVKRQTPLVGREAELALLMERWEQTTEGRGQMVVIRGEAGIGKSRLLRHFKMVVVESGHMALECRCLPSYQHTALYPMIQLLEHALQFTSQETSASKLEKLERRLHQYRFVLDETIPPLAQLLSLPLPTGRYPSQPETSKEQRQILFDTLTTILVELANQQLLLFITEDIHWVDPSTLELLEQLISQMATVPILVLLTCRPAFHESWESLSYMTSVTLGRLARRHVEQMVIDYTGDKSLPVEVLEHVVRQADGVPLFIEEMTKMFLESGLLREMEQGYQLITSLPASMIPMTLQDSLMMRLDRLGESKRVAQLGACIGRCFPYVLLQILSPMDEVALQYALQQLIDAEILYQRGSSSDTVYTFKHALIRDTAYDALPRRRRQLIHGQIAEALETQFADLVEAQPEFVALHYTEAGSNEQAIVWWQRAGKQAIEHSAHVEAIAHLNTGLELLKTLPDTPKRVQHELDLLTLLGPALMAINGQGTPEAGQAYARAQELCRQAGATPQLFPVLWGLWRYFFNRAEYQTAGALAEQCFRLAQRVHDLRLLLEAHFAMGGQLLYCGELIPAQAHLEQGIRLHLPQAHRTLAVHYGFDPGAACLGYVGHALWTLGYPDQALQRCREALALAQELAHPLTVASALVYVAITHCCRREGLAAKVQAEAVRALAHEHSLRQWFDLGLFWRGWALMVQGQAAEGIAQMRQGLTARRASGIEQGRPIIHVGLAEAHGKVGQVDEGLSLVAEALVLVHHTGERWWEAELHRLKGELLLQSSPDNQTEAESCFQQAMTIAQTQSAKAWELRAAMSLSRLWQQQGKGDAAGELLGPIYSWFTEGFDTVDLQDAKTLLGELRACPIPSRLEKRKGVTARLRSSD